MRLSIIILNYNTKDLTLKCVESILKTANNLNYEIIVVDNGSSEKLPKSNDYRLVVNTTNLGFAGGNNSAREFVRGEYVLFLNSDTQVYKNTLIETVKYLDENKEIGALGCKTILPSGKLDNDARRSFPTPWVAFTHFAGLDKLFPESKFFARYWYGYLNPDEIHEVDAIQGSYFLTKKEILSKVNWFSEDYFLDGEDIDLCWKIKNLGLKIIYFPKVSILHIKKASKKRRSLRSKMAGVNSMEIFYKKYLWEKYPLLLNIAVMMAIYILKAIRFTKAIIH